MEKIKDIMDIADTLPIDLKTKLIDRLLNSLQPSPAEIEKMWAEESEKRVSELDSGKVKPIPGDIVFNEIHQRLSK